MSQKYLVTGGAGFIGAYVVKSLIARGHHVVSVDNMKTIGGIPFIHPEAEFIHADICDPGLYEQLEDEKFDVVYHLAAQSAGESSYDNPQYDLLTNSFGTYLVAKFARTNGVKHFIYTSTVAIYGANASGETTEDMYPAPDSIYGVSKFSGELFVKQALRESGIPWTIHRVFNCYGPGENLNYLKKGMVSIYASYIWRNQPIMVRGSLDRYRDFTFIEDCADVLLLTAENPMTFNKIYNLSTGEKTIVRDLIKLMLRVSGKAVDYPIRVLDDTPGDTFGFHASVKALQKDLEWSPRWTLEDGLKTYFDWVLSIPTVDNLSAYHPFMREYGNENRMLVKGRSTG